MPETKPIVQKDRADTAGPERTRGGVTFVPRVDIFENDHELTLYADMPGVRPEDIDLRYERGELHLHGRVEPRQRAGQFLLAEYDEGDFYRAFSISESIDSAKIEAECKDGVLTIHLPKVAAARTKQISVRAG